MTAKLCETIAALLGSGAGWFVAGLVLSLVGGHFALPTFIRLLNRFHGLKDRPNVGRMDSQFLGFFERLLAFLLVAFRPFDPAVVLVGWIGAKLLSNWHRPPDTSGLRGNAKRKADQEWRTRTFIALMAGVLSLGFGVVGGMIARQAWPAS